MVSVDFSTHLGYAWVSFGKELPYIMPIKIIADSCCDTTPQLREQLDIAIAPLTIRLPDGKEYVDAPGLDTKEMLDEMHAQDGSAQSNCPSVGEYAELMRQNDASVVVTLSSRLSGSYNSAVAARELVLEDEPDKKIHVIDSKSASAGELNIALKLGELRDQGLSFEELVAAAEQHVAQMHTLFVLEDLDNLIKNGRITKLKARIAALLKIYPVLSGNDGNIQVDHNVRGLENAHQKLIEMIESATQSIKRRTLNLTLSYCECKERAERFAQKVKAQCKAVKDIAVIPTGGLSSMYANRGGLVVAF